MELRAKELIVRSRLRQLNMVVDEATVDERRTTVRVVLPHDRYVLLRLGSEFDEEAFSRHYVHVRQDAQRLAGVLAPLAAV
jgi:hypothetical protein